MIGGDIKDLSDPITDEMPRGGIEKTSFGELKAMAIIIRFADDHDSTAQWPDYNVLPSWATHILDTNVPTNNLFYPLNLSDFFDRASGGDGNGNLGIFRIVGDVFYVTTLYARSHYVSDGQIFEEILNTLDASVDFSLYDNWTFKVNNEKYNHLNEPDGEVDQIFFMFRTSGKSYGAYKPAGPTNDIFTNDFVWIKGNVGVVSSKLKDGGLNFSTISAPAHEYCHFLFSGSGNDDSHWDGRTTSTYGNEGRINMFSLECVRNAGYISGYERYRLGWLNPTVISTNVSSQIIQDTHIKNNAVIIPLRYDAVSGWLKEYYFLENYETTNAYSGANPFLIKAPFGNQISKGILVFHVKDENYSVPCNSKVSILCADGKWQWKLILGSNTPSDRSDDLIGKDYPLRWGGFDERELITLIVGGITYRDYMCLTPSLGFAGARYNRNDLLGDQEDLFELGYNTVLTKYSNPATYTLGGVLKDVGFEILSYNSLLKEYTLSIQVNSTGVTALKPSKPQNLLYSVSGRNHPILSWEANGESDLNHYKVYKYLSGAWTFYANAYTNSYEDVYETFCTGCTNHNSLYYVSAVDNQSKESDYSDALNVPSLLGGGNEKIIGNSVVIKNNALLGNYPNPFNPSTEIRYQLENPGMVSLKIFDVLGNELAQLVNERKDAGEYTITFNAKNLPSGVYIYNLSVNGYQGFKKMLLLK